MNERSLWEVNKLDNEIIKETAEESENNQQLEEITEESAAEMTKVENE